MSYNTKNYTEQNGEVTHIGGKLIIEENAQVEGLLTTPAANVSESTATDIAGLKSDLNSLLAAMKAAGLMTADE